MRAYGRGFGEIKLRPAYKCARGAALKWGHLPVFTVRGTTIHTLTKQSIAAQLFLCLRDHQPIFAPISTKTIPCASNAASASDTGYGTKKKNTFTSDLCVE
jgi:hypothetical protein